MLQPLSLTGPENRALGWRVHWILRIAVALEFIGHGAFGLMGKEAWLPYYDLFGIPESAAWTLMPLTGAVDVTLGVLILVCPIRAVLAYMAFWGLFTAALRPLAGQGGWELVERAYNFGIPLALLLLHGGGGRSLRAWFTPVREIPRLDLADVRRLVTWLRLVIGAYLVGHGALGLFVGKPALIEHYESIGLTSLVGDPQALNQLVGAFEISLGLTVMMFPSAVVLLFVCLWKLATELLFVTSGAFGAGFEVIERAGAFAAPLALLCLLGLLPRTDGVVLREATVDP